jgi:hypothetical protein
MSEPITAELLTAFRSAQPAFSDLTKWPDTVVTEAFCEAFPECGGRGWGTLDINDCQNFKRRGVFLYAAHILSITYNTETGATDPTNINAAARLNLAGKSVGDESVQYRITAIQSAEDDFLSLTLYGVQYLRLRRRAAMGARAV